MERIICCKAESNTSCDEDRSDAFDYPIYISYEESLAIKQEPAEIPELEDAAVQDDNVVITKPKVDLDIKIEEIGYGLSGVERKCDICGVCFSSGLDLIAHRYSHTEDTYYTCCICNCNTFHLKPDLHRHMLNVHFNITSELPISAKLNTPKPSNTTEKPYQCDICQKRFTRSYGLIVHERSHTGEKPHKCDICNTGFASYSNLAAHNLIHSGVKPFECDICHKRFNRREYLTVHTRLHTGEKPYECDVCHRTFTQKPSLTTHKHIHSGEKPHECDICHKRFTKKSDLTVHNRIHSDVKPYQCDICNYQSAYKHLLILHKRIHSGEKPLK